jgi:hypothetical protein
MHDTVFSEQWLQHLWEHRLYNPRVLRTVDGDPITVLFPGVPNYDSGPDFHDALVRIGTILFRGDVEMHVHANEWAAHRHHLDGRYNAVILHVAFRTGVIPALTASRRELPLLLLSPSSPAPDADRLSSSASQAEPPVLHCQPPPITDRPALLRRFSLLGLERMERKVVRLGGRLSDLRAENDARNADTLRGVWEQLLYEGILEGLGYAKNREPFLRLSRILTLADLRRIGLDDHEGIMAALFGTAGLLPPPRNVPEAESRRYLRRLRHRWKKLPALHIRAMHETAWQFFRLRPVNLPTARLASLACILPELFGPGRIREIVSLFRQSGESSSELLFRVRERFAVHPDGFWAHHLYFGTPQHQLGIALGRQRIDDIIVNAILPWLFLYARNFRQTDIEQRALLAYRTFPPLQRNRITYQVEHLLAHFPLATAQLHQGALEWVRRYCTQHRCVLCPLAHS